jgi:iron complex outermembrane receptor protein
MVVGNAKITLETSSPEKKTYETSSDIVGKFIFKDIPAGVYLLNVSRVGYKARLIDKVEITAGGTSSLNIFLTPVEIEIEKINVTATKTETTLKQTPSSISIVNSDEIKNKNILTFDEVLMAFRGNYFGTLKSWDLNYVIRRCRRRNRQRVLLR